MAHTGKQYPVHFRRDFNYNLDNFVLGYARAYFVHWVQYFGSIADDVGRTEFRCDAIDETTFNGLMWKSGTYVVDGHQLYTVIRTTVSDGWPDNQCAFELWDLSHGLLVTAKAPHSAEYTNQSMFGAVGTNTAPPNTYVSPLPFQSAPVALAVRWARY